MADKTKDTAPAPPTVVDTAPPKSERVRVIANADLTLYDGTPVAKGQTIEMDADAADRLVAITSVRKA